MPRSLFVLLHVPKCAGSTVETHLAEHLPAGAFWSPAKRSRSWPLGFFGRKYDATLPGPIQDLRAVSGHFIGRSVLERLGAATPQMKPHLSVLLREPGALMLSWYNYRMMRYAAKGLSPYLFRTHLMSMPPDPVSHFLLERWLEMPWPRLASMTCREKIRHLEEALEPFDFIGDISAADELIAEVSRGLGIPDQAPIRNDAAAWRHATGWTPLRASDLSPSDQHILAERTRLDRWLWRHWAMGEAIIRPARSGISFLSAELKRPAYELSRRIARGG